MYIRYFLLCCFTYLPISFLQSMVYCLGFHAICTMSKKLLESFHLWKSGFPDLIVWNTENQSVNSPTQFLFQSITKFSHTIFIVQNCNTFKIYLQYKISEVKGPKDTLSSKQRLWMQYLQDNGVCTELCLVKGQYSNQGFSASVTVLVQGPSK